MEGGVSDEEGVVLGSGSGSGRALARGAGRPRAQSVELARERSVRLTRKVITGRSDVRVRDFVRVPRVVRTLDKLSFTLGVLGIAVTEWVMLVHPAAFRYFYPAVIAPQLALRYVLYRRAKWHYFLFDFCYWVNFLAFCLLAGPLASSRVLWHVVFVCANGPLLAAIITWRNSLVFHSVDKVTSVYVHLFPPLLTWCERWHGTGALAAGAGGGGEEAPAGMGVAGWLVHPTLFYLIWQAAYLLKTEILDVDKLRRDPGIVTSLRWLAVDTKAGAHRAVLAWCRKVRLMGPTEPFDQNGLKTKAIFVVTQFLYTLLCFVPMKLVHDSYLAHSALICTVFAWSVFNGACYYIEVFSNSFASKYSDTATPSASVTPSTPPPSPGRRPSPSAVQGTLRQGGISGGGGATPPLMALDGGGASAGDVAHPSRHDKDA